LAKTKNMKKIFNLGDDIIPLSRRKRVVLLIIITCVFQFLLFHSPVLAEEAISQENDSEEMVFASPLTKDSAIDEEAAKFAKATTTPVVKVIRTSTHSMTAYNSEAAQTDGSPCITANGFNVCKHGIEDTVAANFLPMGTKIRIPDLFGDKIFTVRDRMNKRYGERVDVWMINRSDALKFGVRKAKIEVVEIVEPASAVAKK